MQAGDQTDSIIQMIFILIFSGFRELAALRE